MVENSIFKYKSLLVDYNKISSIVCKCQCVWSLFYNVSQMIITEYVTKLSYVASDIICLLHSNSIKSKTKSLLGSLGYFLPNKIITH